MAGLMMSHGADALQVSRMLSQNADVAVRKGVELAVAELGPPPAAFEVMLMGSLGRAEVSLLADQDHAIIYPDLEEGADEAARAYFLRLGARLSAILDAAGYPYCRGGIMSGERRCCQSLGGWQRTFAGWIHTLEAEDLLQAKIFFDFRGALGEPALLDALRDRLAREVAGEPRFLHLLARSVLQYEPPLKTFGGFALEKGEADRATFDIKGVMAQIVDFVRLRALQHGVAATGTIERLDALAAAGQLRAETAVELAADYRFLMDLRLQRQARRLLDRLEPDNRIEPESLAPGGPADAEGRVRAHQDAADAAGPGIQGSLRAMPNGDGAILLLSDVHARYGVVDAQVEHAQQELGCAVDQVLVLGDFGLFGDDLQRHFRRDRRRFSHPVSFIEGNHEDFAAFERLVRDYADVFTHLPRASVQRFGASNWLCVWRAPATWTPGRRPAAARSGSATSRPA